MTQVFHHEVAVMWTLLPGPENTVGHCFGMFFTSKFIVSSAPKRGVRVSVCVCVCKRGLYSPDVGETYH